MPVEPLKKVETWASGPSLSEIGQSDTDETVQNRREKMTKKVGAYKAHRAGSRKGSVHKCFDDKGRVTAISYGKMRGLKGSTLTQWINTWSREGNVVAS